LINNEKQPIEDIHSLIVEENSFDELLSRHKIVFCGNGMEKCRPILEKYPNAIFSDADISSQNMVSIAYNKFLQKDFENVAYFEPFYLKQYVAQKSHVKGLE